MAESDNIGGGLPEVLQNIMGSDDIKNIIKTFSEKSGTELSATGSDSPSSGIPEISPELMAKLPAVISALSGLGIGGGSASTPVKSIPAKSSADRQRKALLSALRPYLSPRRKTIVDALIGLEGLTGLLGALSPVRGTEQNNDM